MDEGRGETTILMLERILTKIVDEMCFDYLTRPPWLDMDPEPAVTRLVAIREPMYLRYVSPCFF